MDHAGNKSTPVTQIDVDSRVFEDGVSVRVQVVHEQTAELLLETIKREAPDELEPAMPKFNHGRTLFFTPTPEQVTDLMCLVAEVAHEEQKMVAN